MLRRPPIFQLTKLALIRNYEKFGGEAATRAPLFVLGILLVFPLLTAIQLALLPSDANDYIASQIASHSGRNAVGALWLFAPKLLLYLPLHYWLFSSPTAKASQVEFDTAFLPVIQRRPGFWGLPFTICLFVPAILLIWPSAHYPLISAVACVLYLAAASVATTALIRRNRRGDEA